MDCKDEIFGWVNFISGLVGIGGIIILIHNLKQIIPQKKFIMTYVGKITENGKFKYRNIKYFIDLLIEDIINLDRLVVKSNIDIKPIFKKINPKPLKYWKLYANNKRTMYYLNLIKKEKDNISKTVTRGLFLIFYKSEYSESFLKPEILFNIELFIKEYLLLIANRFDKNSEYNWDVFIPNFVDNKNFNIVISLPKKDIDIIRNKMKLRKENDPFLLPEFELTDLLDIDKKYYSNIILRYILEISKIEKLWNVNIFKYTDEIYKIFNKNFWNMGPH
jgi:hypothetical protein